MSESPLSKMNLIPLVAQASEGISVGKQKRTKPSWSNTDLTDINPQTNLPYLTSKKYRVAIRESIQNKNPEDINPQTGLPYVYSVNKRKHSLNYHYENQELRSKYGREYNRGIKQTVIDAYGGFCKCCGETEFSFLTVDHINENGAQERKNKKYRPGTGFYRYLIQNNFPKDNYQLLYMNCNFAKGKHGGCPHQLIVENFCYRKDNINV